MSWSEVILACCKHECNIDRRIGQASRSMQLCTVAPALERSQLEVDAVHNLAPNCSEQQHADKLIF